MGNNSDNDNDLDNLEKGLEGILDRIRREKQEVAKVRFAEIAGEDVAELFEKVVRENPAMDYLMDSVVSHFDDQVYPALKRLVIIADVCHDDARTLILSIEKVLLETHLNLINEKLKEKRLV